MVAGVLAVLAALSAAFYTLTRSYTISAVRYSDSVRAQMLAHAGIDFAITNLREQASNHTESPTDAWYSVDYLRGAQHHVSFADHPYIHDNIDNDSDGIVDNMEESRKKPEDMLPYTRALGNSVGPDSDRLTLQIEDAASKININACDNLAVLLDNLCRVIGAPMVAADQDAIQPRRWATEMAGGDPAIPLYDSVKNGADIKDTRDLYFRLTDESGAIKVDGSGRPIRTATGQALYGDGYAIAGYRARNGTFQNVEDVKSALTYVERSTPGNGVADLPLEKLEIEVKFAALRPYITAASWVDTNTVCVGKFEWVAEQDINGIYYQVLIDRDKSWVADEPLKDPGNRRGSLRGSYVSILNGHGAGQLRRIATNGTDWIAIRDGERMVVEPGPISSYLIVAAEDAIIEDLNGAPYPDFPEKLPPAGKIFLPKLNLDGTPVDNPKIDYTRQPLCIHRAPININTASDKVLAALFMGINVQHGHYMAIGTDTDLHETLEPDRLNSWLKKDIHGIEPVLQTYRGLKRLPVRSGKIVFDKTLPTINPATGYDFGYINNYGGLDPAGSVRVNEAHELALRIILARENDPAFPFLNSLTLAPGTAAGPDIQARGPFRSWDDFFFRIVKPWDDQRLKAGWVDKNSDGKMDGGDEFHKASVARMIMAHFNSNTALLKFNPNIEWIDRWGRNFSEMEPVMVHTEQAEPHTNNPPVAEPLTPKAIAIYSTADPMLKSSQRDAAGNFIRGAYITRNYRYKSDELIDKSDLNRSTTEFVFDSSGIFSITSSGQIVSRGGTVIAERRIDALVKVYEVWRESTQRQFVQGKISRAAGDFGSSCSGQVTRDAFNKKERLSLVTQPEVLMPLQYTLIDQSGAANPRNTEAVDSSAGAGQKRNAFGKSTDINVPDVVANRIMPAGYDGQIVLATNTSRYDTAVDKDTFLASFDGDLDTANCAGNGHEQAKCPHIEEGSLDGTNLKGKGQYVRVVDTIGLLGALNDNLIDTDPGLPPVDPADTVNGHRWVYRLLGINAGLKPLQYKPTPSLPYYNNCTLRMGDLRTDGVYLSSPGVSGNDATLKYLYGNNKENLKPDSAEGNTISMWTKTTWHQNDFRHHEFFNASNPAPHVHNCRGLYICKYGQYTQVIADDNQGIGHGGNRTKINDLMAFWELGSNDWDYGGLLHGGYAYVPKTTAQESPSFRVQPFRWSYLGARRNYFSPKGDPEGDGPRGHWLGNGDYLNQKNQNVIQYHVRPFIDTQLHPEGPDFSTKQFWCFRTSGYAPAPSPADQGNAGALSNGGTGQDVKWEWADPPGVNGLKCFGANNLNFGSMSKVTDPASVSMHYRYMPEDGTYAVIDELKISSRDCVLNDAPDWKSDRVVREQSMSRYYLPLNPGGNADPSAGGAPTFTSQTMLQSKLGFDKKTSAEEVTLVRVAWTAFTPRFMHEYKTPLGTFKRIERLTYDRVTQQSIPTAFRGPFDYEAYNNDDFVGDLGDDGNGRKKDYISVNRPSPDRYPTGQAHATKGLEIELLRDPDGVPDTGDEVIIAGAFTNPDAHNGVGTPKTPIKIKTSQLRYRVRFRYPVDPLVDPSGGTADAAKHLLLDTPVFDDISITYFLKPRILSMREVNE